MSRFIYLITFLLLFKCLLYGKALSLVYNSPNFNVYILKQIKNGKLIIEGTIENLYYVPLIDITGYVDALCGKHVVEKKRFYIGYIGEWGDVDSKKNFTLSFSKAYCLDKLKFTINFEYGAWKESTNNYEYFIVKIKP